MLAVVATMHVKDGMQAEFENIMGDLVQKVRANEPGCQLYTLTKKQGSATEYVAMELYKDAEALEAHGKSDHIRTLGKALAPCMAARPEVLRMDVLA